MLNKCIIAYLDGKKELFFCGLRMSLQNLYKELAMLLQTRNSRYSGGHRCSESVICCRKCTKEKYKPVFV